MASAQDVSAVVCTLDSIASIRECLQSLRNAGVGELIVVDARSTDGTRQVANELAYTVVSDSGIGLGNARNTGIALTTCAYVLNMGSDNVMPPGELDRMLMYLRTHDLQGVSAQTFIEGDTYVSKGLNNWRKGRFIPGPSKIIGTPTLFDGDLLRSNPFDVSRQHSDDSELCERWSRDFGARFAISDAHVFEIGKANWTEVKARCRLYGISDAEVFSAGRHEGWDLTRRISSLLHPARVDFFRPLRQLPARDAIVSVPFFAAHTALRYAGWAESAARAR